MRIRALSLVLILASCAADVSPGPAPETVLSGESEAELSSGYWYQGSFRCLPEKVGRLVEDVERVDHPDSWRTPTSRRRAAFSEAMDAMLEAVRLDFDGSSSTRGDWCGVAREMREAGYRLSRYYDTDSRRYFLWGEDTATDGEQALFVLNPYGKRNLVIEAPHDGYDLWTGAQGIRIFLELAARAFLMNGSHRCASSDGSPCSGTSSSCVDGPDEEPYRRSDVAHATASLFHLMHAAFEDRSDAVRFVQLHGFSGTSTNLAMISDGAARYSSSSDRFVPKTDPSSISVAFRDALVQYVGPDAAYHSCQESDGHAGHRSLCATENVQGRYTNGTRIEACTSFDQSASGRFLHVEQAASLRDDDVEDGRSWRDVAAALNDLWPQCDMRNGEEDCTLGGTHARQEGCTCGVDC